MRNRAGECNAQRFGDLVAVCDVDQKHIDRAVERFTKDGSKPDGFSDFRKLLERDDIDAIVNGTEEEAFRAPESANVLLREIRAAALDGEQSQG